MTTPLAAEGPRLVTITWKDTVSPTKGSALSTCFKTLRSALMGAVVTVLVLSPVSRSG